MTVESGTSSVWANGVRREAVRPLADAERDEVDAVRYGHTWRAWLFLFSAPLAIVMLMLLGGVLVAISVARQGQDNVLFGFLFLALLLGMVVAPVCLALVARDHFRRARLLSGDFLAGTIELYRFPSRTGEGDTPVEILSSGLVWRSEGRRVEKWELVNRVETAEPPAFAAIAAEWLDPVSSSETEGLHLGHRELSPAELADLHRYLQRLVMRPAIPAVLLGVWSGMGLMMAIVDGRLPQGFALISFTWVTIMAAFSLFHLGKALHVAARLHRDMAVGRVIISRQAVTEASGSVAPAGTMSPPTEYLPESQWIWTIAGQPAPWRTQRRR